MLEFIKSLIPGLAMMAIVILIFYMGKSFGEIECHLDSIESSIDSLLENSEKLSKYP